MAIKTDSNELLARTFYEEVFGKGRYELLDKLLAPGFVDHYRSSPGPGPEGVLALMKAYREGFPDIRFQIEDVISAGDKVVTRFRSQGTNTGPLMGAPPTGKACDVTGISVWRVQGGKIVENWTLFDELLLMQELGAAPTQQRQEAAIH